MTGTPGGVISRFAVDVYDVPSTAGKEEAGEEGAPRGPRGERRVRRAKVSLVAVEGDYEDARYYRILLRVLEGEGEHQSSQECNVFGGDFAEPDDVELFRSVLGRALY